MGYISSDMREYLTDAAAGESTPGGGSVSALVGALAASMSEMAGNFTVGKEKYADVESEVARLVSDLKRRRQKLLTLVDADVEAYGEVDKAYGMPKDTEEQKADRTTALQVALGEAMKVPLNVMRQCAEVGSISVRLAEIANPNLITDVGVSAILAEAACAAARLNVEINLKYLKSSETVEGTRQEIEKLSEETSDARSRVSEIVSEHLSS